MMQMSMFSRISGSTDTDHTEDERFPHLPPVSVGLFQEYKPFALPNADLPSIRPAVIVVILGLQDHRTAGDPTHRHPPGSHHRRCSGLLVPHRTPPGPWQHGSTQSRSASCAGRVLAVDTGDTGQVSVEQARQELGQCHALKQNEQRDTGRDYRSCQGTMKKCRPDVCRFNGREQDSANGNLG